jgi:hypothetical protein
MIFFLFFYFFVVLTILYQTYLIVHNHNQNNLVIDNKLFPHQQVEYSNLMEYHVD